jgi:hypothetical protein
MKTNLHRSAALSLIALFILFSSCSKDDDNTTAAASKSALLSRNWKQTDLLAGQVGSAEVSVFNTFFESCNKDDIWQFKADGTYKVVEGASKCASTDPDTVTSGTWQLTENDTKIIIDDISEPAETLTIRELTSSSFKASGTQVSNGTTFTATIVFTAQ